jgi:nucleoside-diphosphate-sugar epimerase
MKTKKIIVLGGGGFIGSHLVKRLKQGHCFVRSVDIKYPEFSNSCADEFILGDLTDKNFTNDVIFSDADEVYQLAADMGGAGYIFTKQNDSSILYNSLSINLNVVNSCRLKSVKKLFFSSSACVYPEYNQQTNNSPICSEDSVYPAQPDSEYGWEKLTSERLYLVFSKDYGIPVRIARYHNVFGSEGSYNNGKEKVPAALCRKIALAKNNDTIDIWGSGEQTRSFLYIDDAIDATLKLMRSDINYPLNIGSEQMISINNLALMIANIAQKQINIRNIDGPIGVQGRKSDNTLIKQELGWEPKIPLDEGILYTYQWIHKKVHNS